MPVYTSLSVVSLTHLEAAGPTVHKRQDVGVSGKWSDLYSGKPTELVEVEWT